MLAPDKIKHFVAGALIGAFAPLFGWYAFLAAVLVGVGKEVYDRLSGKGTPEVMDAVATMSGALLVVLIMLLARYLI